MESRLSSVDPHCEVDEVAVEDALEATPGLIRSHLALLEIRRRGGALDPEDQVHIARRIREDAAEIHPDVLVAAPEGKQFLTFQDRLRLVEESHPASDHLRRDLLPR